MRQGNDNWFMSVRWTLFASLEAEQLGTTSANMDKMLKSKKPNIKCLLGTSGKAGKNLSSDKKLAYNTIKNIGNYGEVFERNVGKNSPLKMDRRLTTYGVTVV